MRILQIGVGRWGLNHLRVLLSLRADVHVAEISAPARRKCLEMGIPPDRISDDYRDFLDKVPAVDIVTPASTHFVLCKEVLEKKKDVFVEKPLAQSVEEGIALEALAFRYNLVLQVGHIFRYDPATDFIKALLQSEELGNIQSFSGRFSGFKRPRSDGGVTLSDAIHFLDLFNYVFGRAPEKVMARCEDLLNRGLDDMVWIWSRYDRASGVVEADYFSPEKKRLITIKGEKATLVCDFSSSQDKIRIYRNRHILDHDTWKTISGEVVHKETSLAEPLFLELGDFLRCVQTRSIPKADARSGIDALRVVQAALESHIQERMVSL